LSELIDKYPDLRFGQILIAFNFILPEKDPFFEEPVDVLSRIK